MHRAPRPARAHRPRSRAGLSGGHSSSVVTPASTSAGFPCATTLPRSMRTT
jgi:hypothetical protein